MRVSQTVFALLVAAAASGCGETSKTGDAASGAGDMTTAIAGDLAGADLAGAAGKDGAAPKPDLAGKGSLQVYWHTLDKNIQGQQGGFSVTCDNTSYKTTELDFTATAPKTGASVTTKAPCPAGESSGTVTIALPDASDGPFNIVGTSKEQAGAKSYQICAGPKDVQVTMNVFLGGCDHPECLTPMTACMK